MKKPKKLVIFIAIIVVVIGLSATAAIILSNYNASRNANDAQEQEEMEEHQAIQTAREADRLSYDGDMKAGLDMLDASIEATDDVYEKYILYSEKATLYLNNGRLDEALEVALKAYDAQQTANGAALIAQISEEKGDRATAAEYYRKAVELVNTETNPLAEHERRHYQEKADELGRER